jgi:hydroxyacylglutathione hydrolase
MKRRVSIMVVAFVVTALLLGFKVSAAKQAQAQNAQATQVPAGSAQSSQPPAAQAAPGQAAGRGPLATTSNGSTDQFDRSTEGPITRPQIIEIAYNTYFINEFGMDSQYVVVGKTRALAIDTGSGFYDYKGTIAKLTTLPYDVVVTHGHPDHAGGIGQFDVVYMHPADIPMVQRLTQQGQQRYGELMWNMPVGYRNVWGYTPADAKWGNWGHLPTIKPLSDGQVFDLGGRKVTVYHIPGHTAGSCVFLDDQSRIVFSGDAANGNVGASATAVSTLLKGLIRLQGLRTEYDRMYNGHTAYGGSMDAMPESPETVDDVIEAFRSVLRGNPDLQTIPNHMNPSQSQTVAVHGRAHVTFNPNRLWEDGEEHIVP